MQKCSKCGVLFKTDNPQRTACYDCVPVASAKGKVGMVKNSAVA